VVRNIKAYARSAASYGERHGEIFNPREQSRLGEALAKAAGAVRSGGRLALDFGAGSGNVTRHMIGLGYEVTAADVSPHFLRIVQDQFDVKAIELFDGSLSRIPDEAFDLIGAYSVMHHVPDYLTVAAGLVTKLKPGGVMLVDHERNQNHWLPSPELAMFRQETADAMTGRFWDPEHKRWQYLLRAGVTPSRHVARRRKKRRIAKEGDIHVYPDDNIDWDCLIETLQEAGTELVERMDYLLFWPGYDELLWDSYRGSCSDVSGVIVRRRE
jgi:SAM-dependent methyltransferase